MREPDQIEPAEIVAVRHAVCPRCGLHVEVIDLGAQLKLRYDYLAWERACQAPVLGGPTMCLSAVVAAATGDDGRQRH